MSGYAVRKDGNGFRAVASSADINAVTETFSATEPAIVVVPQPDLPGFIADIKAALGGIVALNGLMRQYPAFTDALNLHEWTDLRDLVIDAKTTNVITQPQYAAFQTAFSANNIPITLS